MIAPAAPAPIHCRGRSVHYFAGRVRCPLAGIGTRAGDASNRLAIESADTAVTIDRAASRITVRDERAYQDRTILADLLFLAEGETATGEREPFSIHLKVRKHGHRYSIGLHLHRQFGKTARFVRAVYEPFEVLVSDRSRSEVVCDPRRIDQLITRLPLVLRIIKPLLMVRDHDEGEPDHCKRGYRVADFSLGFSIVGFEHPMVRIQLISLDPINNAPLIETRSIVDMMRMGTWELNMISLSDKWVPKIAQRDIFHYGIEELAALHEIRAHGLRKGQTLGFRFAQGYGEIVVDRVASPMPNALDIARAYAEFHVNGGLIADRAKVGPRLQVRTQAAASG